MEEMKPNGNVTWGMYVAEQILVALSFFFNLKLIKQFSV